MRLSDSYVDAEGNVHTKPAEDLFLSQSLSRDSSVVEERYSYKFGEQALAYPQPLTVRIERYWNPLMDTQAVDFFTE